MSNDFVSIVMNPVRQRIIQYLAKFGQASTSEIGKLLSDVPSASLYRHVRLLREAGLLEIAEERPKRGAVQKVYRLAKLPEAEGGNEAAATVRAALLSVLSDFERYFSNAESDPERDMLLISNATFMLSDEEFAELLRKLGELFGGLLTNTPDGQRRQRRITLISSPSENESSQDYK